MNVEKGLITKAWDFYLKHGVRYRWRNKAEFCEFFGITAKQHGKWIKTGKLHVKKSTYFKMLASTKLENVMPEYLPAILKALEAKLRK